MNHLNVRLMCISVSIEDSEAGYSVLNEQAYRLIAVQSLNSPVSVYHTTLPKIDIPFWIVKKQDEEGFFAGDLQHYRW